MRPSRMWARRTPLRTALHAALDLGDHPAGDRAVGHQRVELVGRGLADQAAGIVDHAPQTLDVGEVDELLRTERLGDRPGDRVGVDVVRLAVGIGADRRDDRDELVVEQADQDGRVDRLDVADEAEVGVAGDGADQAGVLADTPTASGPWTLIAATSCGLTWPISTIRAMSMVSPSVTRRPLRNSLGLPSRVIRSLICGPPPCTTTGRIPTWRISTMSWANRASASPSDAPGQRVASVLDDDDLIGEPANVRQRLDQGRGPVRRRGYGHGYRPTLARPAVSGRPRATLAAWTAPPEAPLARLSMAQIEMTVFVRSSKRAVMWATLLPIVAFVDGEARTHDDERLAAVAAGERGQQRRRGDFAARAWRSTLPAAHGSAVRGAA